MTAKKNVPVSEASNIFRADWTEEDCIKELQRIVAAYPEKHISRNFFRVHANCSEATWNRFFGTFHEYKRQAGIVLTRQQHNLEKHIAKHASVDHYREFNKERQNYGESYIRSNKGRFQTVLFGSDFHDREINRFFLSVFIDTAKRVQPDIIVLNGDIFDLPEFSHYLQDPRSFGPVERIRFVHEQILKPLREACPDAQIDFIEGNHEFRLLRHLADATPALMTVLADLHGFTIPKLLGLDEFELNYIAKGDLSAYKHTDIREQVAKNYKVYFDCLIGHHFPEGQKLGMPGVNGHHHRWFVYTLHNELFGAYQWVQQGCGHVQDASYCNGDKWSMGFTLAHVDTHKKLVNFDCITVTDFAVVGGKFYYKEAA